MNETELCFDIFLEEEFSILDSKHGVPDKDVIALDRKLVRVYDSLKCLKKVDIRNITNETMLLKFTGKTLEMVSEI